MEQDVSVLAPEFTEVSPFAVSPFAAGRSGSSAPYRYRDRWTLCRYSPRIAVGPSESSGIMLGDLFQVEKILLSHSACGLAGGSALLFPWSSIWSVHWECSRSNTLVSMPSTSCTSHRYHCIHPLPGCLHFSTIPSYFHWTSWCIRYQ